ncbi:RNA-binding protein 34 [Periplaneta americana]|uniref:RNA-binding protein 34 n=1 Tax=Periplaneta americana TaxID=6978 RepID=UPI0037E7EE33
MEYKVGSLADLISSGIKSTTSRKKKLFKNVQNTDTSVKFEAVQKSKRKNIKKEVTEDTSPVKCKKIKLEHKTGTDTVEHEADKPNAMCAAKRIKKKRKKQIAVENQDVIKEHDSRSIFVGNVPNKIRTGQLKKLFKKYGKVEAVRLRSAPLADPRVPKKVAVIKKSFHPNRTSIHAYVRFVDVESAKKALAANGKLFADHYLRVDMASKTDHDQKKAVFLGNVPFSAEENDLWKMFDSCGKIVDIRIIRDKITGVGKGFAYVNFETTDAVELALKLNGEVLKKREIRVERCVKKPHKKFDDIKIPNPGKNKLQSLKTEKESNEDSPTLDEQEDLDVVEPTIKLEKNETDSEHKVSGFQGQKVADKKKKKKKNKDDLKKIAMRNKLLPKSKLALLKFKKSAKKPKSLSKKMKFKPSLK